MCGIAGIYCLDRSRAVDRGVLTAMNRVLAHRGPDGQGIYCDGRVGLAHRRLSIIDVSGGSQPMFSAGGAVAIVFNGEIYNYQDLRARLIKAGHEFATDSDTEIILHLYEEKGLECLTDLCGMFAFAIADRNAGRLFIARDRLGIKPLYYTMQGGDLIFGSEIKALLEHPGCARELDPSTLSDYFSFLYVPAPKTAFRNIWKLPPGHQLVCSGGDVRVSRYWEPPSRPSPMIKSEQDCVEGLREVLGLVVRQHMLSDVPLGAFLSGGVDSSSIVALMQQAQGSPVSTFTIGFAESGFDESAFARETAAHLHTAHHEQSVTPDLVGVIEQLAWHLDEPFADSSAVPTFYVCKMVRDRVTVALSGDGGDEVFAGYGNYRRGLLEQRFRRIPLAVRKLLVRPAVAALPELARGRTFLLNLAESPERAFFNRWRYFDAGMKSRLFSEDLKRAFPALDSFEALAPHFEACSKLDLLARMQYVDMRTYLVDDILTKVDKMSMACSLEVRVPFLDHRVVEFAHAIPSHLKLNRLGSKYVLRRAVEHLLPRSVFERPKHGFLLPVGSWLRGGLRALASDILFDARARSRGYFDQAYVRRLWELHQRSSRVHVDVSLHLWSLLMFELWHRTYLDAKPGGRS